MPKKKSTTAAVKPVKISGNFSVDNDQTMYLIHYNEIYKYTNEDGDIKADKDIRPEERAEFEYDQELSQASYMAFKEKLIKALLAKFPSLTTNTSVTVKNALPIVENKLFAVLLKDNEWSLAVQIVSLPDGNKGLQTQMLPSFTIGLRDVLLDLTEAVYVRTSTFSVEQVTKDNLSLLGTTVITKNEDKDFPTEDGDYELDPDGNSVI